MKNLIVILMFPVLLLLSCNGNSGLVPTRESIDKAVADGEFSEASKLIKLYLLNDSLSNNERFELGFKLEQMDRIRLDFNKADTAVTSYVKKHYPGVTDEQIAGWIKNNALENMTIDGKQLFFARAARNLFRIDSTALANFDIAEAREPDSLARLLSKHVPALVNDAKKSNKVLALPKKMKITYSIEVKPDVVPDGEMLRVWLPYPRRDKNSQTGIKLLATSQPDYIISPDNYLHSSMYMEKRAKKGESAQFKIEYEYTSNGQFVTFDPQSVRPYKVDSDLYKTYTSERSPQILFSDNIKAAVKEAVGEETNPYLKARKIYEWIDQRFPWASAREYSTMDHIPEYVLANKHGDCGMVSLLFITMARCAGIPAKWQSGWMMHPGNENLHDWAEAYYEGIGWVPVDQSFGRVKSAKGDDDVYYFYTRGLDSYRLIVNDDFSADFYPAKVHFRSENIDFQRGEVEWRGGNLYFNKWRYNMKIEYLN